MNLFPHQKRAIDKIVNCSQHGIIIYHTMGSGKTLSAIACIEKINGPKLVITPASLIDNFYQEAKKHSIMIGNDTIFYSYEKGIRVKELAKRLFSLVIFDEAHRLRNTKSETYKYYQQISSHATKVLLLTGTAEYNQPSDIGSLINFINPKEKFPDTLTGFCRKYIDQNTQKLKNIEQLSKILKKYVDFHNGIYDPQFYPTKKSILNKIVMSKKQEIIYKYLRKKLPFMLRKIVEKNLPASLPDSSLINMYASAIRQASDSIVKFDKTATPWDSPKLVAAAHSMVNAAQIPYFRGMAYSNYLEAGLNPYTFLLKQNGLKPLVFTGSLTQKQKMNIVEQYNQYTPEPMILLISSSGGEGLNLKGTRLVQILEPHFNRAKIEQIISRAARYESHGHLEHEDRTIIIEEYFSLLGKSLINKIFHTKPAYSIDEFLYAASLRKQKIINEILSLL